MMRVRTPVKDIMMMIQFVVFLLGVICIYNVGSFEMIKEGLL